MAAWATSLLRDDLVPAPGAASLELKMQSLIQTNNLNTNTFTFGAPLISRGTAENQRAGDCIEFDHIQVMWSTISNTDSGTNRYAWAIVYDTMPDTSATPVMPLWTDVFSSTDPHAQYDGTPDAKERFIVVHHEFNWLNGKVQGSAGWPCRTGKFCIDLRGKGFYSRYKSSATAGAYGNIVRGAWHIMGTGDQPPPGATSTDCLLKINMRLAFKDVYVPGRRA